jgi:hypothetical protein
MLSFEFGVSSILTMAFLSVISLSDGLLVAKFEMNGCVVSI